MVRHNEMAKDGAGNFAAPLTFPSPGANLRMGLLVCQGRLADGGDHFWPAISLGPAIVGDRNDFEAAMSVYRYVALAVAAMSAAAMLYVGLYQSRLVGRMICPIFGEGCQGVADAPFARPFGIPDGYIGVALYVIIFALLLAPPARWIWIALLALSVLATLANILGVRDMMIFGSYCFYCLTTTLLSPVLL